MNPQKAGNWISNLYFRRNSIFEHFTLHYKNPKWELQFFNGKSFLLCQKNRYSKRQDISFISDTLIYTIYTIYLSIYTMITHYSLSEGYVFFITKFSGAMPQWITPCDILTSVWIKFVPFYIVTFERIFFFTLSYIKLKWAPYLLSRINLASITN